MPKPFEPKPVEAVQSASEARDIAVEWQHWQSEQSMSWGEVADWEGYFEQLAGKFPELKDEFKENAII